MPAIYPNWFPGTIPHTNGAAKPTKWRSVQNVVVIEVNGATYRNSKPIDGIFEVVDVANPTKIFKGKLRSEVYCSWCGVKPPTVFPQILIQNCKYKIINNYTGNVIDNLS